MDLILENKNQKPNGYEMRPLFFSFQNLVWFVKTFIINWWQSKIFRCENEDHMLNFQKSTKTKNQIVYK